jgi:hypothetical protein
LFLILAGVWANAIFKKELGNIGPGKLLTTPVLGGKLFPTEPGVSGNAKFARALKGAPVLAISS